MYGVILEVERVYTTIMKARAHPRAFLFYINQEFMSFNSILHTLHRDLIQTFARTDEWFDRDDALLNYNPASGGWNAAQVLEHIVLTSRYLLLLIDKGSSKALSKSSQSALEVLEDYVLTNPSLEAIANPDSFVWERPEHIVPVGAPAKILRQELRDQLDRCLCTLELLRQGQGIQSLTTMSVNNLGKLDVYQYIYFLVLHIKRHLEQLRMLETECMESGIELK